MSSKRFETYVKTTLILSALLVISSCAHLHFNKPQGEIVGSCEGTMQSVTGAYSPFILSLYSQHDSGDNEYRLYFTQPGKTGYMPVKDIEFENGIIHVTAGSRTPKTYSGKIGNSPLKINGTMKGFEGSFTLDIKQYIKTH